MAAAGSKSLWELSSLDHLGEIDNKAISRETEPAGALKGVSV